MLFFDSISWKNTYFLLFYITICSLEIGYIYLLIIYLKNDVGYKFHKLDIFTLFSTLIVFTTYLIQSLYQKELIIVSIINIFTEFVLNTILCSIKLITLSDIFTEYINMTNYSISIIALVVIFSVLDIFINNVHSLIDEKKGRNIKIFVYIIEILFGLITVIISLIKGFSQNIEDYLPLNAYEEDIYIRHLSASMIRRVKELNKTYLIFITTILISTIIDVYLIFIYNSENFYNYVDAKTKFDFDDFFSYTILYFIKDLLPYLIMVISTLIYRYK